MISSERNLLSDLPDGFSWQVKVDGNLFHVETNKASKKKARIEAYRAAYPSIGLSDTTIGNRLSSCQIQIVEGPDPLDRVAICNENANI